MKNMFLKIIAGIFFVAMIVVNFLANSLPINNRSTGDISNSYPNLFTPASFTFSIWGLIYFLLAGYVLYQFLSFKKKNVKRESLLKKINLFFIATSIANISWIFAWHYDLLGLSVLIMIVLLILLIKIADILKFKKMPLIEKIFISTSFFIYFGWITIATIANVTTFLVSIGWKGFGLSEIVWTNIILLVGLFIGILRFYKDKNIAYICVFMWAYFGILFKHLSLNGFNGKYPSIIVTLIISLCLFGFSILFMIYKKYFTSDIV